MIIDFALKTKAITDSEMVMLRQYFPTLGPKATDRLYAKLNDILLHPEIYPYTKYGTHHDALFIAAKATGDPRFAPIFKKFAKNQNVWIAERARSQYQFLQDNLRVGISDQL